MILVTAFVALLNPPFAEPKLEGTWNVTHFELAGSKLPKNVSDKFVMTLKGGKYDVFDGSFHDRGSYTLVPGKTPKAMDIVGEVGPNKGRKIPAIYEFRGADLAICYNLAGGKDRPKAFASKGKQGFALIIYRRAKG